MRWDTSSIGRLDEEYHYKYHGKRDCRHLHTIFCRAVSSLFNTLLQNHPTPWYYLDQLARVCVGIPRFAKVKRSIGLRAPFIHSFLPDEGSKATKKMRSRCSFAEIHALSLRINCLRCVNHFVIVFKGHHFSSLPSMRKSREVVASVITTISNEFQHSLRRATYKYI